MERHDAESKKGIETNSTKNMFSVVKQVNAGYGKYFDAKPKTSTIRSECYSNYKTCGAATSSKEIPKRCVGINDEGSKSEDNNLPINNQDILQEFFPKSDAKGDETKQRIAGGGCCRYLSVKTEK